MINETSSINDEPEWIPGLQLSACIFYTIIFLVGITGNILVIVIVVRFRDMRTATNYLLMNLSIADLAVLLFCTPDGYQHLYGKDKHRLGTFMCQFNPFIQNTTATCSVLTIMAISYERYVAVCQPFKTSNVQLTLFRTLPTVIFFWFVSSILSIPFFYFTTTSMLPAKYNETISTCFTHFSMAWSTWYLIPCTVFIYLIILVLICYWNYSICYVLFNREALLRDNTVVTRHRRQVSQLLIVIIVVFFVSILPYKIWAIIQPKLSYDQLEKIGFQSHSLILVIGRCLLYLNSAINPIFYSILSTKFRQSFVRLWAGKTSKDQRSSAVLFYKEYAMRPMANKSEVDRSQSATTFHLERRGFIDENRSPSFNSDIAERSKIFNDSQ